MLVGGERLDEVADEKRAACFAVQFEAAQKRVVAANDNRSIGKRDRRIEIGRR